MICPASALAPDVLQTLHEGWPLRLREGGGQPSSSLRARHKNHVCGDVAQRVGKKARGPRKGGPGGVTKLGEPSAAQSPHQLRGCRRGKKVLLVGL